MADEAHRHQPTVKPLRGDAPVVWDTPSDRSPAHDAGASESDSLCCVRDDRRTDAWLRDDSMTACGRRCPGDFVLCSIWRSDSRACLQRSQVGDPQLKSRSLFLQIVVLIVVSLLYAA
jgi:hypothetical protein